MNIKKLVALSMIKKMTKNVESMPTENRKVNVFNTGVYLSAEIVQKLTLKGLEIVSKQLEKRSK